MNKTLIASVVSALLLISAFSQPVQAGTIDKVKTRVDAIKDDTGVLKSRTSAISTKTDELISRAEETASTANAIIAETDLIKQALAPLGGIDDVFDNVRGVKNRFDELQFSPADLIANDELQGVIEKFQKQRAETEARLNDPGLEVFRSEFLEVLQGLRAVIAENVSQLPERTPFQTLIEAAPAALLAPLKFASEHVFADLKIDVLGLAQDMMELRNEGAFDDYDDEMCLANRVQKQARYKLLVRATKKTIKVIRHLKSLEEDVPVKEWELGIHGYTSVKIRTGDKVKKQAGSLIPEMEAVKDRLDLQRELVGGDITCE